MARSIKREQQAPTRSQSSLDQALPNDIDAERSILGAVLLDNQTIHQALRFLTPDDFYRNSHKIIFEAQCTLQKAKLAIDPITLQDVLRRGGNLDVIGGAAYLGQLIDGVPRFSNILEYCKLVKGKAIIRKLIITSHQIIAQCYDEEDNAQVLYQAAEASIFAIRNDCAALEDTKPYVTIAEALGQARAELRNVEKNEGKDRMATGFAEIDAVLSGGFNNETVLLAAETSKGKSLLAQQFALHNAHKRPERVGAIFTLEMSAQQMGHRTYQIDSGIESKFYKTARFVQDELDGLAAVDARYAKAKLFIYEPPSLSPGRLYADCLALKQAQGRLDYVIVDYLDLMTLEDKRYNGDYERIKSLSKELHSIKRALGCNLILPVQFKPGVNLDKDELNLGMILYASALVPDADIAVLFQPGAYENHLRHYKLHFAKNRNSVPFTSPIVFNRNVGRFESCPTPPPSNNHPDEQND